MIVNAGATAHKGVDLVMTANRRTGPEREVTHSRDRPRRRPRRTSTMLTLTPMATAAVRKLVAATETDSDGGLRIAPGEPASDGPELSLRIVDAPEDRDRTVETDGVHVFLEPTVVDWLDDKLLDATVDSGSVRFALFQRKDEAGESPAP
jgi:Fe-S cluster assembly iron-binding protein IscA